MDRPVPEYTDALVQTSSEVATHHSQTAVVDIFFLRLVDMLAKWHRSPMLHKVVSQ